jgi:phytoene synthase
MRAKSVSSITVKDRLAAGAERELALSYAPRECRAGLAALLALDDRLAGILRSSREPMLGQMRLTWWAEALAELDRGPPPSEPVLAALAAEVLPRGVPGARLAGMVDAWEAVLLDDALGDDSLELFGRRRGGLLFSAAALLLGASDPQIDMAGEGWALADLAANLSVPVSAARARSMAGARIAAAMGQRWSRAGRALGAMTLLARADLNGVAGPRRVGRLLVHRLTGR